MAESAFNATPKNIGNLLGTDNKAQIVVPTFQRGYSWGKKHVQAFWNDIMSFQKEKGKADAPKKYFLGPIVVLEKSNGDVIELLDGQQRLATTTILFSVLRDFSRTIPIQEGPDLAARIQTGFIHKEDLGQFSLVMGETDVEYFRESIQVDSAGSPKPAPKLKTERNIKTARDFLMESVKALTAQLDPPGKVDFVKSIRSTLRYDLVMACIPVDSERDAFKIFETLNDRGLRLSVPDLLLNYLMRVALPESDRPFLRAFWNEMLEKMGRRDIDRFIRHMWVSKYGDLKAQDLFTALKEHIEQERIGSLEFTRSCAEECERYVQLLNADEKQLGPPAHTVRSLLHDLDFQSALPPLLAAYGLLKTTDFERVVRWILVFVVRYSIIAEHDASGMETVFFKLAREIRGLMKDAKNSSKCLAHIKETLTRNAPEDAQVKLAFGSLILSQSEAHYIVSKLANHIQSPTKEVKLNEANLEHVFPKRPSQNEWGGKKGHEALEPYLWHVGNLTMLGVNLNSNSANSEYSVKKAYYSKTTELVMTKQLASKYSKWNKQSIEARAKDLSKTALQVWNFDNPSRV